MLHMVLFLKCVAKTKSKIKYLKFKSFHLLIRHISYLINLSIPYKDTSCTYYKKSYHVKNMGEISKKINSLLTRKLLTVCCNSQIQYKG